MSLSLSLRRFTALAVGAFLSAGCAAEKIVTPPIISLEQQTFASGLGINLTDPAWTKLPSGVYIRDLTVGSGATATANSVVNVFYTLWLPNGTQIDSNVGGTAFQTGLGPNANLIEGWKVGIPGMKVGGKRRLVIPSSLAYGPQANGSIPPNANLVFDVTLASL